MICSKKDNSMLGACHFNSHKFSFGLMFNLIAVWAG